jgi:hypothetical protein
MKVYNFLLKNKKKAVLGVLLNLALIAKMRSKNRTGDTRPNYLIMNMALSNIGICIFAFPLSAYAGIKNK